MRSIALVLGLLLLALGAMMLLPALVAAVGPGREWPEFLKSSAVTLTTGALLVSYGRSAVFALQVRDMFVLTVAAWVTVSGFAALPFMLIPRIGYADAFFETMSGITTTGSTVLVGLDHMPPGILLWRALLQWAGGIGFIGMAVAILPFLRVGGMRLFLTESSDRTEKLLPRAAAVARAIVGIYVAFTVVCALAYCLTGMTAFEAACHAMTTVSTGGYSTSDASLGHFGTDTRSVAMVFMLLGAMPFTLYIHVLAGRPREFWRDAQMRGFLGIVAAASIALAQWLVWTGSHAPVAALRESAFAVSSIITTTGFVSEDYSRWGQFALMLTFYLTFLGGCSGSTAGGVKIFRFQIAALMLAHHIRHLVHPRAVLVSRFGGQRITDDITRSVVAFSFFYAATIAIVALGLALIGLDPVTALSGAASAVSNVGPGLGDIIGPAGNYSTLPATAKVLLSLGMLMGRLEIITVLVVLTPGFWRA